MEKCLLVLVVILMKHYIPDKLVI